MPSTTDQMRSEKRMVAAVSVYAAIAITALKILVGFSTGSLGILSEAAHSGLDLVAAVITLLSIRISDKPADADHQYGHGKFENFSAFIETGLLLLTCIWIVYEAVHRLFFKAAVHLEATAGAFAVMAISIAIDTWRSRKLQRIAVKYDSQALAADALHFSTDIWSSTVVIIGLGFVWLAGYLDKPWLKKADAVAALFVALIVVYVSSRLARQTVDALLDAAPVGVRSAIIDEVSRIDGILEIGSVRIRRGGNRYFADLGVAMDRNLTFQAAENVTKRVTDAVHHILPDADVVVHSSARARGEENIFDRIRAVATRANFNVHDISVQDLRGRLHVEQHLELDERLSLKEAHDQVTVLENEMRRDIPEITSILTHIESEPATIETGDEIARDQRLERAVRRIASRVADVIDIHEVVVKRVRDKLYLSCHCTLPDTLPLSRVHDIQTDIEIRLKQEAPELFRVLIHPEPATDNRR